MTSRRSITSASEYRKVLEDVKPKIDSHWFGGTPLRVSKRRSSTSSLPSAVERETPSSETSELPFIQDTSSSNDWRVCHVDFKRLFKLMQEYMDEETTTDDNRDLVRNAISDMHSHFLEVDKALQFLTNKATQMLTMVEKHEEKENVKNTCE